MNIYDELTRHFRKNGKRAIMTEIAASAKMKYWKLNYFVRRSGSLYPDELIRLMIVLGYTIYAPDGSGPVYGGTREKIEQDILDNLPANPTAADKPEIAQ